MVQEVHEVYEVQKPEGSQHVSRDRPNVEEGHHWELLPYGKLTRENLWRRFWSDSFQYPWVFSSPWTFQIFGEQLWNDNLKVDFRGRWKRKVGMASRLYCFLSTQVPQLRGTCPKSPPKSCLLNQHTLTSSHHPSHRFFTLQGLNLGNHKTLKT